MKSLIVILIFAMLVIPAFSQQEKQADSKITRVTVFMNRAQVTRDTRVRIDPGKTEVIISGLTAQLDQQSIQVSGKGNFILLGINYRQNYLSESNKPRRIRVLEDSLAWYKRQVAQEQLQRDLLNKEEQMLISNQKVGGANHNLSVNELRAMSDFFRTRFTEIGTNRLKSDDKVAKLNAHIARLNQQLQELTNLLSRNTGEIVVSVFAESAITIDLELNYVVYNAGWYPLYDVRAINTRSPLQLGYKANVFQGTGEEWENVKLKLSTANPAQGGVKPEMHPWYIDFYQPVARAMQGRAAGVAVSKAQPEAAAVEFDVAEELPAQRIADYVQTVQTSLNTEFEIGLPYTVVSGTRPTLVDIQSHQLNAVYTYGAVPKLDSEAFLLAKTTGWEALNLLPGVVNVFFEGTFVGKSFIDPNAVKDTLAVSLGRDKRIVLKREQVKDFTTRRTVGANVRETQAWEISVRNTRNEPVKIALEDQLPISKNSQIEVTVIDVAGAQYNKETGKLVWDMTLQPNETKKVVIKYEVRYPKDKQISGL
ncbi:MAG: DUF4139 domain-containing protein [Cyclobacteriaceae bacterium]|nr:DUF4139 domain-containing protein [Cyclobacteriaceae bacterium]